MKLRLVFLSFVVLCAFTPAYPQIWSSTKTFEDAPGIQFLWRTYGVERETNMNRFQWILENVSDSTVAFDYFIMTSGDEKRVGRIVLKPRAKRISGWTFAGDRIQAATVVNVEYIKTE